MANAPKMDFHGTQQTCYADWSRCVLSYYPFNPKYQRNGDTIVVFNGDERVAEYDFSTGKGYIIQAEVHSLEEVGKLPNFEQFDVDTLLVIE